MKIAVTIVAAGFALFVVLLCFSGEVLPPLQVSHGRDLVADTRDAGSPKPRADIGRGGGMDLSLSSPIEPVRPTVGAPESLAIAAEQLLDILKTPHNVFYTLQDQARELALSPLMLQQLVSITTAPPAVEADGSLKHLPERIRGLDLLEIIAELPEADDVTVELCQSVLTKLVRRSVEKSANLPLKQAIVADKHDALTALTHINATLAVELFREFTPGVQRDFMGSALLLGLVDLGWERTVAQRYILSIP